MDASDEQRLREIQREYLDFLDDEVRLLDEWQFNLCAIFSTYISTLKQDQGYYSAKVRDMISENRHRLIVNINDLRRKKQKRARAYDF
jgi:DNA replication licensing factor MCM3